MLVDYSVYLVTDGTPGILGDRSLGGVVRSAVEGGVTVVQYRDKHGETAAMIETAKTLRSTCEQYSIPLIINDRVDVALASNAQGVHLGQTDMGIAGVRKILERISTLGRNKVPTVAIGGINFKNVQRVVYMAQTEHQKLDGVAVVSAIMAAEDPMLAAQTLRRLIKTPPAFIAALPEKEQQATQLIRRVPDIIRELGQKHPLCHNMTNLVVQNFAANVALAIGSSPIMANNGDEAFELAALGGALVINMGSLTPEAISNY
ncbi:MAG: hypothetical protein Q9184_005595, partial [Pyrenodesmia sp. 2 TL-2023]